VFKGFMQGRTHEGAKSFPDAPPKNMKYS
jgi:hypothetical protein